jgi:CDP-glucose 4,6-dehydratase
VEGLEVKQFGGIYQGKRVLVTGHTGFKGSWLSLWLQELGANVAGVALSPESQLNHWNMLGLDIDDHRIDMRDYEAIQKIIKRIKPEIIFHLAAQPLVRRSYENPVETWATNVMGTVNLMDACRQQQSAKAILTITTDKCYENREWLWSYRENDRLGGHDPYSASKAATELVVASYRSAYGELEEAPVLATARAGNVIGGGDWSEDRLIPDLVRALEKKESLEIRSPNATRPWQHVLDALSGYLRLGQNLLTVGKEYGEAWNFGPDIQSNQTVSEVLIKLKKQWKNLNWHSTKDSQPHEATLLNLDSTKARNRLHWQPIWDIDTTLTQTADWYDTWLKNRELLTHKQLAEYINSAKQSNAHWINL